MPTTIMHNKNYYSHCPLKKRPVFIVKEENTTEIEPENLSTKPEDLLRTGNYPEKVIKSEEKSSENVQSEKAIELELQTPKPELLSHSSVWHKPLISPNPYMGYLPFGNYSIPLPSDQYNSLYYHHPIPSVRDSSVSPPAPVFIQPFNKCLKAEKLSHRFMPYQLNHHHHNHHQNLLPMDASSLSPTPSNFSYNSFMSSNSSMRSNSPSSISSTSESLSSNYSISALLEKSPSKSNIQKSPKSEKSPPRYQCPDCGKSYSTYSGLTKHQQFHCAANESNQVQKTVTCEECGKAYSSTGALKMHIRTHTLPCKCHLCGKAFSRPWLLQGHIRTHTGEKPFSCTHCHRAFADRSNLRAHLQTHSNIKKYSCTTCSKTFSRMSLLTKHNETGCPAMQIKQQHDISY